MSKSAAAALVVGLGIVAGCTSAPAASAPSVPVFTDVTHEAWPAVEAAPLPPSLSVGCGAVGLIPSGAAVADFDDDGNHDVLLTRVGMPNVLLRNRGDGTFADATAELGLGAVAGSSGAAWLDVDGDDNLDLWVASMGLEPDMLFIQGAGGRFTDEGVARGVALSEPEGQCRGHMSVSAGDPDHDGDLDVFVARWDIDLGFGSKPRYFRNDGTGHFTDATETANVSSTPLAFTGGFADADGDGWEDLFVASDFGTSRLLHNRGDGTFVPVTDASHVGTDENGMGSAIADFDADGDLDWLVTSIHGTGDTSCSGWGCSGNRLYLNDGRGLFTDGTDACGVREGGWGWGAAAFDANGDGWLDLVTASGYRVPGSEGSPLFAPYENGRVRLWIGNAGGAPMAEVAAEAGAAVEGNGRAVVPFDADGDGDQDLLITHAGTEARLLRNDSPPARSLVVRVRGRATNRHGIGAEVTIEAAGRERLELVHANSGFLATGPAEAWFGLGDHAGPVAVRVRFPATGREVTIDRIGGDRVVEVVEPE